MSLDNTDPFAGGESRPSVSFKNSLPGTNVTLVVDGEPKLVQARDFDTEQPAYWPDGNPKMTVVMDVLHDEEPKSLWAPKPSSMFAALAAAQKEAGARFAPGGVLMVEHYADKPNENPKKAAQKLYRASYVPPKPADPFAEQPAQPAPQAAAPAQQAGNVDLARQLLAAGLADVDIAKASGLPETAVAALRNTPPF